MKEITLEVASRKDGGKGVARKLRAAKRIPAIIYGKEHDPRPIDFDYDSFHMKYHNLHGENALVNLVVDGQAVENKALIRDMQHDPVYGNLLHIDFQLIQMNEKIRMSIPVKLVGTSIGVKNYNGVLQWTLRDLTVHALPQNMPEHIEINIEEMNIGDAIHVGDLKYENVEFSEEDSEPVVSVIAPKLVKAGVMGEGGEAAEGEVAAAETTEESAEPEVISEKKAEERKAEKGKKE
jgi:large subunit ribosomal protein L25